MYTTESHLRILGLKYEWTPYFKSLATYFQNVHLYATGYLNISHLLKYVKGIKDIEKKNYMRIIQKGEKKLSRSGKVF